MTELSGTPLQLEDVSVRFGDRIVLESVDITVHSGELVALAGPNGSGKTTLIRAALGLQSTSTGAVRLFGDLVGSLPIRERARRVAWVPQEESPRDNVPVATYVSYGRYARRGSLDSEAAEDHERAEAMLAELGLADRANDGILELSGGERQRLVLARALVQETPLLLLDEPTSHLDIGHQLELLSRVRDQARRRGLAVLAAIHDLNLAARFSDRIAVLSHGRVVAVGAPGEVLSGALLRTVWGVAADLRTDPRTGLPYLLPRLPREPEPGPGPSGGWGPVHVVGGGGAAAPWMQALVEAGYRVTAGALHLLDTDAEAAEALGIPVALEAPFAPLGPEVRARNREMLSAARAVVIAPFAVGPSNLANLEDAGSTGSPGTLFLAGTAEDADLDFAGGAGTGLRSRMAEGGAVRVRTETDLIQRLAALRATEPGGS
jgi:iron complex transport system ATP-binding protein